MKIQQIIINLLLVTVAAFFFTCDDDGNNNEEPQRANEPIFVIHGDEFSGTLSTFKPMDDVITEVETLPVNPLVTFRTETDMFILSDTRAGSFDKLHKLDLTTNTIVETTQSYTELITGRRPANIAYHNDKLYIPDFEGEDAFVSIVNAETLVLEDTVNLTKYNKIVDIVAADGKLFVHNGTALTVFALPSLEKLHSINNMPFIGSLVAVDEQKLIVETGKLFSLNTNETSLTLIRNTGSHIARPAVDPGNDVLYMIYTYAQPAPTPYGLEKFDITSKQTTAIVKDFDLVLNFEIKFVTYHKANDLIVVGGTVEDKGVIKTFTTDGKHQKTYELETSPIAIY